MGRTGEKKLHGIKSSAFAASAFKVIYLQVPEQGMMHGKEMVTNESF